MILATNADPQAERQQTVVLLGKSYKVFPPTVDLKAHFQWSLGIGIGVDVKQALSIHRGTRGCMFAL